MGAGIDNTGTAGMNNGGQNVATGVGGAAGALRLGIGAWQWWKGNQLAKHNVRPTYNIPDEMKHYLSQAEQSALEGLPAEQKQQYLDNISRNMSAGLYGLNSRNAGIGGIGNVVGQANEGAKNLLVADANQRMMNKQQLQTARQSYANFQDKTFQLNSLNPYYETANKASALQGAGIQNTVAGADAIGQSFQQGQQNTQQLAQLAALGM